MSAAICKVVKPALARGDNARNSRVPPELGGAGIKAQFACVDRCSGQAGRDALAICITRRR
ncbi:MAG: hypothetical protein ACLTSK_04855 [Christensenellales bacterium]